MKKCIPSALIPTAENNRPSSESEGYLNHTFWFQTEVLLYHHEESRMDVTLKKQE